MSSVLCRYLRHPCLTLDALRCGAAEHTTPKGIIIA